MTARAHSSIPGRAYPMSWRLAVATVFLWGLLMVSPVFGQANASWTPDPAVTAQLAADSGLLMRKLEAAMRALLNNPATLTIELLPFGDPQTTQGHLKKVYVKTARGTIDNLVIDRAEFDFEDVQLNTTKLVNEEKLETIRVQNVNMDVAILEADLNTFLQAKAKAIKVQKPRIELRKGGMYLSGETKYGFIKVQFSAEGGFSIRDSKEIWFHPTRLKLNSMTMPRAFVGSIVKRINPVLNLEKFPFRLNLKEIVIEPGSMRFTSFRQDP